MRLKKYEIEAIKESFASTFAQGSIYLFGSRVDDNQKGGDIDLYIDTKVENKVAKKIDFLVALKNRIGEQKIDVVLSYNKNRAIEQEAIKNGIEL
ncbi:MAG: nucleotidyltransferase domain-containing protein [Campylobacterales bacterium]|nr:nucleotidyltransferase domain-containing protein [Campylobacterales bacterium]